MPTHHQPPPIHHKKPIKWIPTTTNHTHPPSTTINQRREGEHNIENEREDENKREAKLT